MYQLACKDLGMNCTHVTKAETVDEVVKQAMAHAQQVHMAEFLSMTPQQMAGMADTIRKKIVTV